MTGITDASAMRRPRTPYTLSSGSTTALLPAVAPILQVPTLALPAWHAFIMEVAFERSSTPDLGLGQTPCRGMGQREASCMLLCAPHAIFPSEAHALPLPSAAWLVEDRIVALTGVDSVPDEAVNGRVGLFVCARVQLALGHARQRGLLRDLPRQPDAAPAWQQPQARQWAGLSRHKQSPEELLPELRKLQGCHVVPKVQSDLAKGIPQKVVCHPQFPLQPLRMPM